jgi:hypothetical protein
MIEGPILINCLLQNYPQYQVVGLQRERSSCDDEEPAEFSAAESAINEISSLFEMGENGKGFALGDAEPNSDGVVDNLRLPGQAVDALIEDCFEYVETDGISVKRRWWASENPRAYRVNMTVIQGDGDTWRWLDENWVIDVAGNTSHDGFESSPTLSEFTRFRDFSALHRYRRRRWFRARTGGATAALLNGITAFYQSAAEASNTSSSINKVEDKSFRISVQVNGGNWGLSSFIPHYGTVHGAIRATGARWPHNLSKENSRLGQSDKFIYEMCYSISPLDGEWGYMTRVMLLSPRFLLRNDSLSIAFEVKQAGTEGTVLRLLPGATIPFHWVDCRLPELISIRPATEAGAAALYRWTGGFDPLLIGSTPLRTRWYNPHSSNNNESSLTIIQSVKVETDIRPKTGGTGITITLQEEDSRGWGALFRVENLSSLPLWISQDGLLGDGQGSIEGDLLRPSECMVFGLDVPYRQGKYSNRKAATMDDLLRARVGLAPLNSRNGIETTKVISMTAVGGRVRLNPSKIMAFTAQLRSSIRRVRVIGVVFNDGPTRVLRFW